MLTGSVVVDLTDAARDKMRHRLVCLADAPAGVRIVVRVGALAPEPEAVRLLAGEEPRLLVDLQGTPRAIRLWRAAVIAARDGEVLL